MVNGFTMLRTLQRTTATVEWWKNVLSKKRKMEKEKILNFY